ncbi:MAG: hypothetical protein M3457_02425 [Chloroflexota bacterium]|nr:hypothetical protein [Chloroflexota bacterium]
MNSIHKRSLSGLRIIVLGYIVRGPLGGLAWHHLQYVLGLIQLGHQVSFVEQSENFPSCYDPIRGVMDTDPTYGLRFASKAFSHLDIPDCWAYHDAHTSRWLGPAAGRIHEICKTADLLLNLSGVNPIRPWFSEIPVRVFVDTDPAFTQIRHLTDPASRSLAAQHTAFLSFGENIAEGAARIPADGFAWQATRQPVVLDAWKDTPGREQGRFTTVMQWDSYAVREYEGVRYGMKSLSFDPILDLPGRTSEKLELAIGSATAPRRLLRQAGWYLRDPLRVTQDPWSFQRYIARSKAEFTVAKHGYVISNSGWFSERSANYLASGRPVVTQQTGFSRWLRADAGVVPFETAEEALLAIEDVSAHYDAHCRTAREIVHEYFNANKILGRVLNQIG